MGFFKKNKKSELEKLMDAQAKQEQVLNQLNNR